MKIGFIGQGYVGKPLADFVEEAYPKHEVIRYDLEDNKNNAPLIKQCSIVFIAVPTPTETLNSDLYGSFFVDCSALEDSLKLVGKDTIAVIKSTTPPKLLRFLQDKYKKITIMHVPEFLTESTAMLDTRQPDRNLVGVYNAENPNLTAQALRVLEILPAAKFNKIVSYEVASLAKYAGNSFFVVKNVFFNLLYDLAERLGVDWEDLHEAITHDHRIHPVHTNVMHKGGRGAGNHCLIKDFATFKEIILDGFADEHKEKDEFEERNEGIKKYYRPIKHPRLKNMLNFMTFAEKVNVGNLVKSRKDLDILAGVYKALIKMRVDKNEYGD